MKLFTKFHLPAWALLVALLAGTGGCASRSALQRKTSWYKHHKASGNLPCPCGKH